MSLITRRLEEFAGCRENAGWRSFNKIRYPFVNAKWKNQRICGIHGGIEMSVDPSTGLPETTVLRAIKGSDALYSVQHAWRAVPSDEQTGAVLRSLSKVTVCDGRTDEHPCGLDAVAH
jgi:hypothetical protein